MVRRVLLLLCWLSCIACEAFIEKRDYPPEEGGGGSTAHGGGGMGGFGGSRGNTCVGTDPGTRPVSCEGVYDFSTLASFDEICSNPCLQLLEDGVDDNTFSLGDASFDIQPGLTNNFWYDATPSVQAPAIETFVPADVDFSFSARFEVSWNGSAMPSTDHDGGGVLVRASNSSDWLLFDWGMHGEFGGFGSFAYYDDHPSNDAVYESPPYDDVTLIICRENTGPGTWNVIMERQVHNGAPKTEIGNADDGEQLAGDLTIGVTAHDWDQSPVGNVTVRVKRMELILNSYELCL